MRVKHEEPLTIVRPSSHPVKLFTPRFHQVHLHALVECTEVRVKRLLALSPLSEQLGYLLAIYCCEVVTLSTSTSCRHSVHPLEHL